MISARDTTEDGAVVAVLDRVVQRIFRASLLLRADGDVERAPRTETATEELAAALGDLQSTLLPCHTASDGTSTPVGDCSED